MRWRKLFWAAFLASNFGPGSVLAVTIDFDTLTHGQIVDDEYVGQGVTISAVNVGGGPDLAVAFSTTRTPTEDPDLIGPPDNGETWNTGNLAPASELGNVLIIQERGVDRGDGIINTSPDDEGSRPAGYIQFDFDAAVDEFGFDLIDVENVLPPPAGENGAFIALMQGDSVVGNVSFWALVNPSAYYDPTITFGDNSANRIRPITAASMGIESFDRVQIWLGGSGAVDNIVFTSVPEPATLSLMGVGLIGVALTRRRRKAQA